eukprot:5809530-Prymnesium_polylepis.1
MTWYRFRTVKSKLHHPRYITCRKRRGELLRRRTSQLDVEPEFEAERRPTLSAASVRRPRTPSP